MPHSVPLHCPACNTQMAITEFTCPACNTRVSGHFDIPGLHRLTGEQVQFVEVFLRCRGNIREVEKDLGISYPTVRSRLDQVIATMGFALTAPAEETEGNPAGVLNALEAGELSFEEALERIREDGKNR